MAQKWGSNEDIHIGDIFQSEEAWSLYSLYYQVTALRGKTQVVLHAIDSERYINELIQEDSPLYWRRKQERPLPGQFLDEGELGVYGFQQRGKWIRLTQERVTAWVLPDPVFGDRLQLRAVGLPWKKWGLCFYSLRPEDWEPWDAETIRRMEEEDRAEHEELRKRLLGKERQVGSP